MTETPERPATILIVDDDWMNREVLEAHLLHAGYRVVAVQSSSEALAVAADGQIDLILLDVRLPGMDGYEVCQRLKAAPATAQVPIVLMSAWIGDEERESSDHAGADYLLAKSGGSVALLEAVERLLRDNAV